MLKQKMLKHGVWMVKQMNDIKKEIDELFSDFENSKLYQDYLSIKKQLNNNEEIINIIEEIKRLQKIIVNTKDLSIENKLDELNKRLEKYPIYQDYVEIVDKINNELYTISDVFDKYFGKILKI